MLIYRLDWFQQGESLTSVALGGVPKIEGESNGIICVWLRVRACELSCTADCCVPSLSRAQRFCVRSLGEGTMPPLMKVNNGLLYR